MRVNEFLLEAKPENLGDGMIKKIARAYFKKEGVNPDVDSTDPIAVDKEYLKTGYGLANAIYNHIGPKYLIWVVKQYIQDQYFSYNDIRSWKDTLDEYTQAITARKPIERDINKFANIDQLRTELRKQQTESIGKMYDIIVPVLDKFVQQGQAKWLYKGTDYVIYKPDTWEASNAFYRVLNNKGIRTSACVTYDSNLYDRYSEGGPFVLTIAPETGFVAYIKTNDDPHAQLSEFSDVHNNHDFGLEYQLKHFPKLRPILTDYSQHTKDPEVLIHLNLKRLNELYPKILDRIKNHNLTKIELKPAIVDPDLINHHHYGVFDVSLEDLARTYNDPKVKQYAIELYSTFKNTAEVMVVGKTKSLSPITKDTQWLVLHKGKEYLVPGAIMYNENNDSTYDQV